MPKEKKPKELVPLWMLTFGDLNSLMMTFFILLFALSTQSPPTYLKLRQKLKEIRGVMSRVPKDKIPEPNPLDAFLKEKNAARRPTGAVLKSIKGNQILVRKLDEGTVITVGGPALFEAGAYAIRPQQVEVVREISKFVKGYANMLHVYGHTSSEPNDAVVVLSGPGGGGTIRPYEPDNPAHAGMADRWLLSYLRAREVSRYLVQGGDLALTEMDPFIDPRRIRLTAMSQWQGLVGISPLDKDRVSENRRVEIVIR